MRAGLCGWRENFYQCKQEQEFIMISSIGNSSGYASQIASTLYSRLDTKNQGYFEVSDIQSALENASSSSTSSTASSASDVFSQLDSNSDGKVTKDELTSSLQKLAGDLNSQYNSMRMGGAGDMPPPPPPGDANGSDGAGFTKDQLQSQLDQIGSTDSKHSSLISGIVNNFDKADSNGDGKVSASEAMAFDQSNNASSTGSTGSTTPYDSSSATASKSAGASELNVMKTIMLLMQSYGQGASNVSATGALSTTA
jgi:hypothetical protein